MQARLDSLLGEYESGRMTRRDLIASLALLVASSAAASDSESLYGATELNHVTIRVSDLKRSREFYQHLLGLSVMKQNNDLCYLKSNRGFLCLWQTDKSTPTGFDHFCFGIPGFDRAASMTKLSANGLSLRHDPDDPKTVYVRDPDNITVQLEPAGFTG
jgi:catechol 2,3-dioxygenase-like lactoylglutathione lyase family enzyme